MLKWKSGRENAESGSAGWVYLWRLDRNAGETGETETRLENGESAAGNLLATIGTAAPILA